MEKRDIAKIIDHTNLSPTATMTDIKMLCKEAVESEFATVCIHPFYVKIAKDFLKDSKVKVCTVVGFPLGMNTPEIIKKEALRAINDGAKEIDMVINQGALKSKDYDTVYNMILEVRNAIGSLVLKVILEVSNLTDDEILKACELAVRAGADFVKTSTGFSSHGATTHHVKLMKDSVGDRAEVKASGGIKTYDDAIKMIRAGATRLGTSSGVAIVS